MKVAVVQFPGSNCDYDTLYVLKNILGLEAELVWHKEFDDSRFDSAILPGGFSYGDCLRAGAIAAHSSAIDKIKKMADEGLPVLGICNGFQILAESNLLPGALLKNSCLKFVCRWVDLRVESTNSAFSASFNGGSLVRMPVAHHEGRYFVDEETLMEMERNDQIVFRYAGENPNGSVNNIAGVRNSAGNVVGLMPHPERACERILGSEDGKLVFHSMISWSK